MKRILTRALVCLATIATTNAVAATGRTPGSATISPSGAATYSIPLWTPPGIRGLAPSLALVYSSRAGDGLAGVGFNVVFGQSTITRCNQTIAQDGANGLATLSSADKLCLDGNRLRLTGGTFGAANSTYQTEIETFSKIIAKGTAGSGPQWFEVWGKNGLIYEYGNTTDSRIESNLTTGGQTTTVRAWTINKIRDRTGNEIKYKYIDDTTNGSFRPDEITWAGNTNVPIADRYKIKFVYETPNRPDPIYSYMFGDAFGIDGHVNEFKRLDRIEVHRISPALWLRNYDLIYDPSGGISGRSRLQSFKECAGSAGTDCLSQTTFDWQNGTPGISSSVVNTSQTIPTGVTSFVMDISGDGRDDVVWSSSATSGSGTWRYMLANSTGGYGAMQDTGNTNTNFSSARPIQWNGDDKWDLLVPYSGNTWHVLVANGSGFNAPLSTGVSSTGNQWIADVDGDGRGDLIRATNVNGIGKVYLRLRSGSGFGAESLAIDMATWGGGGTTLQFSVWGAAPFGNIHYNLRSSHKHPDFDGDSREDFILSVNRFNSELGTNTRMLYIIMGRGSTLATGDNFGGLTSLYEWRYGDWNGDGKTDIGYLNGSSFYYAFSRGTSLFGNTFAVSGVALPLVVMDYDGDGKDEIVSAKSGSSNWWYARSTGWSLNALVDSAIAVSSAEPKVGDIDGDGLHDLPFRQTTDSTWKARKHNGLPADYLLAATDGFGVKANFTYASIAKLTTEGGCYTRDAGAPSFPVRAFRGDLIVACTLQASNGIGGTYT